MFAIAEDGQEPVLWRFDQPDSEESQKAKMLFEFAVDFGSPIYAYNSGFESAISHYRLLKDVGVNPPDVDQFVCTQAMCRRSGIPVSLADSSAFLQLTQEKDKKGKLLIGVFSDQTKAVTLTHGSEKRKSSNPILENPVPWDWTMTLAGESVTVAEAWDMFCSYCRTDVKVEREVHRRLKKFELSGSELEGFLFTSRMNALGAPVNMDAAAHAFVITEEYRKDLERDFQKLTGLMPTQTAKVLAWLQEQGYAEDNLQSATMESMLGSSLLTPKGSKALEIRSYLSFAAIKKVGAILETACPDSTLKGMFTWYGASATGRWTSSGVQLQNARKASIPNPDAAYKDICDKTDLEIFGFLYGNPYEAVASCVRNFIQPSSGNILAVDFSNIESRVAAWLAGQDDLLDMYRSGRDAYKELAVKVFGVKLEDVTKEQRFVGKVGNLSLVFQTAAKTFHETCAAWGMPIDKKLACLTVKTFREENHMFPKTWRAVESSAVKAVKNPGEWFKANDLISFAASNKAPFPRLVMRLASGRDIVMPLPEVVRSTKKHRDYETGETREWESDDLRFYSSLKNHSGYGMVSTYGGSLFQSATQATARDIMQNGCVNAQKRGYRIFSIIHDEVLAYDDHPDGLEGLESILCEHPDWLPEDFPLAASGEVCPYYTKS